MAAEAFAAGNRIRVSATSRQAAGRDNKEDIRPVPLRLFRAQGLKGKQVRGLYDPVTVYVDPDRVLGKPLTATGFFPGRRFGGMAGYSHKT